VIKESSIDLNTNYDEENPITPEIELIEEIDPNFSLMFFLFTPIVMRLASSYS